MHLVVPVPDAFDEAELDGRRLPVRDVALTTVPAGRHPLRLRGDGVVADGDVVVG